MNKKMVISDQSPVIDWVARFNRRLSRGLTRLIDQPQPCCTRLCHPINHLTGVIE